MSNAKQRNVTGNETKMKPSEKLNIIEQSLYNTQRRVGEMEVIVYNVSRENEILRDALQLLDQKLNSVVSLSNEGKPLTNENINEKSVELKEQVLKERIQSMLDADKIEKAEEIGLDSIIVGRECNKDGEVENPRIQFLASRLSEDLKQRFVGKKVGELMVGDDDRLDIEIMEIYNYKPVEIKSDSEEEVEGN